MNMLGAIAVADALPAEHRCAHCDMRMHSFCRWLDARALEQLSSGVTMRFGANQPIVHQGDPVEAVYNVKRGMLKTYKLLADGRRQVIGFLLPGDFLGLAADEDHAFSVEAVEPAELCRFSRSRFEAFVQGHPAVERELYHLASRELAVAREQIVLLGRKTARERLASFLLGMGEQMQARGALAGLVRLPMSRTDIGDYLGLTKETVSRVFTVFKTSGLIRLLAGDVVRIVEPARLAAIADMG
jgi:CRP/FNR family transcriptional regulator